VKTFGTNHHVVISIGEFAFAFGTGRKFRHAVKIR
jgi:hypothetical protein